MWAEIWKTVSTDAPSWVLWPSLALLGIIFIWPQVRNIAVDLIPRNRKFSNAKKALELQKLYFEVEALKKNHGLSESEALASGREIYDVLFRTDRRDSLVQAAQPPETTAPTVGVFGRRQRVMYGALGGVIAAFMPFLYDYSTVFAHMDLAVLLGMGIRIVLLGLVGGAISFALKSSDKFQAFAIGAAGASAIIGMISLNTPVSSTLDEQISTVSKAASGA